MVLFGVFSGEEFFSLRPIILSEMEETRQCADGFKEPTEFASWSIPSVCFHKSLHVLF
jgi:hypothetical protein